MKRVRHYAMLAVMLCLIGHSYQTVRAEASKPDVWSHEDVWEWIISESDPMGSEDNLEQDESDALPPPPDPPETVVDPPQEESSNESEQSSDNESSDESQDVSESLPEDVEESEQEQSSVPSESSQVEEDTTTNESVVTEPSSNTSATNRSKNTAPRGTSQEDTFVTLHKVLRWAQSNHDTFPYVFIRYYCRNGSLELLHRLVPQSHDIAFWIELMRLS